LWLEVVGLVVEMLEAVAEPVVSAQAQAYQ
jgi:hypothetical protein